MSLFAIDRLSTLFLLTVLPMVPAVAQTPVHNPANGHYYCLIISPTPISWQAANNAAQNSEYRGMTGYLATVTSRQESDFLKAHVYRSPLIPEAYSLRLGGFRLVNSAQPKEGWRWVTGEPWRFTEWADGEPNNAHDNENRLSMDGRRLGTWNDIAELTTDGPNRIEVYGYVVEYGKAIIAPPPKRRARR